MDKLMKHFSALYYPEIVCLDELILKSLVLLYDKLYFLPNDTRCNPGHTSISSRFSMQDLLLASMFGTKEDVYAYAMYGSESSIWDDKFKRLMETYDYLEQKGICIPIEDEPVALSGANHPLYPAVAADMNDSRFKTYCNGNRNSQPIMLDRKDPRFRKIGTIKGGGACLPGYDFKHPNLWPYLCSERINTVLYTSDDRELIPASNKKFFNDLFAFKLKRILKNPEFVKDKKIRNKEKTFNFSIMSWEIFTEIVPVQLLIKKSMKKIVRYKNASAELQSKFHDHIFNLQYLLTKEPWDESIKNEIEKIVALNIVPEAEKVREKKKLIWKKLFDETIKTTFSVKVLTPLFSIYVIPNVSHLDIVAYSAAAASWTGGILNKLIDLRREQKEVRRNAMFFLLNFK
jgi:hypothetical protein